MKLQIYALSLFLGCVAGLSAEPLRKSRVAGDSKWLLHLDLDTFRSTKLGQLAATQFLDKALADLKEKSNVDLGSLIRKVRSITAYGTDIEHEPDANGILLVQADTEAIQIFEGMLAAQSLGGAKVSVTKLAGVSTPLYSIEQELFVGVEPGNFVVIGKSRKQIEKARSVISGRTGSVDSMKTFAELLPKTNSIFFLAVAEGLSGNVNAPPQAKVLQMADGGRLTLGEKGEDFFVELVLRAKEAAVAGQIQMVVQGMIALASLSQADNQDIQQLVRGIKVSGDKNIVTISLQYPLNEAIKKLEDQIEGQTGSRTNSGTNPRSASESKERTN